MNWAGEHRLARHLMLIEENAYYEGGVLYRFVAARVPSVARAVAEGLTVTPVGALGELVALHIALLGNRRARTSG